MRFALFLSTIVIVLSGCQLFGPREFEPKGTAFHLNPAISVTKVDAYTPYVNPRGLFQLGLYCRATGDTVCDTLVAGLFFVPKSKGVQAIIILKPHIIRVGATDTIVPIGGFCCHSGRSAPDSGDLFEIGPVTNNSKFEQLIGLVRDKDITYDLSLVQMAVWDITDNNRLSQTYIDQINALPPDTSEHPLSFQPESGRMLKSKLGR
ncbi:MAG: hypothetical protein ABIK43_01815 [candidate division WOR-3 bacterium]